MKLPMNLDKLEHSNTEFFRQIIKDHLLPKIRKAELVKHFDEVLFDSFFSGFALSELLVQINNFSFIFQ